MKGYTPNKITKLEKGYDKINFNLAFLNLNLFILIGFLLVITSAIGGFIQDKVINANLKINDDFVFQAQDYLAFSNNHVGYILISFLFSLLALIILAIQTRKTASLIKKLSEPISLIGVVLLLFFLGSSEGLFHYLKHWWLFYGLYIVFSFLMLGSTIFLYKSLFSNLQNINHFKSFFAFSFALYFCAIVYFSNTLSILKALSAAQDSRKNTTIHLLDGTTFSVNGYQVIKLTQQTFGLINGDRSLDIIPTKQLKYIEYDQRND